MAEGPLKIFYFDALRKFEIRRTELFSQ